MTASSLHFAVLLVNSILEEESRRGVHSLTKQTIEFSNIGNIMALQLISMQVIIKTDFLSNLQKARKENLIGSAWVIYPYLVQWLCSRP